jgi:hypothetical protein
MTPELKQLLASIETLRKYGHMCRPQFSELCVICDVLRAATEFKKSMRKK